MTHTADSPAPTRRIARERLARKREKVRAGAAAMRRETFHAGMWATRAPLWMWPALLVITGIGAALRFFRLDFPHRLIFDETYYVKDGYSVFNFGYERSWPENADDSFNAGDPSVIEPTPEYVVHPPLGKWLIGWGIDVFGADDSFGWRFTVAIIGTLTIFFLGVIAWKLFRSAFFACVAAGLLAIDGEHFVHSRTSLLDIVLMAFVLLAFFFILLDREQVTKRLASWTQRTAEIDSFAPALPQQNPDPLAEAAATPPPTTAEAAVSTSSSPSKVPRTFPPELSESISAAPVTEAAPPTAAARRRRRRRTRSRDVINFGPRLGARPWIFAAGISLGLATGVKWSGLYALAVFGILLVLWDVHSRSRAGVVHPWLGMLIRDSIPSFCKLVPIALVTYVACWTGWIRSDDAWDRQWAAENFGWWSALPKWLDWLPSLAHYHYTAYSFHVGLDSEHPYMSNPWGWIVQWRPTSFYYESYDKGDMGCTVAKCSSAITSVGNPVVWGLAALAVLVCLVVWIIRRDVRPAVILAGLAATWLPWFAYQERTIFTFYTIVMVPFVVLAVTYCLTLVWGRVPVNGRAPAHGRAPGGGQANVTGHAAEHRGDPPPAGRGPSASASAAADRTPSAPAASAADRTPAGSAAKQRFARISAALFARRLSVGLFLVAAILAFAYFWPIYTGEVIPFSAWNNRMWNITWR
ncbi:dolichyl-phosphate-mannose--protein mannosyltransferase [Brevibacterium linens]|uniref:dolichyl-phosphate-mannose--protein mannosyltransferase n=1 Tax=Brevibacterium linens TaxID=1703 RepID=UPI001F10E94A|nr:phospholipid carrier-dependent glycosyltransferase [Brevibacterium linens]